jgi:uncharacterized protein (DUF302 family)
VINDPPPKRLLVGFDHLGNAIEVIVIEDDDKNRKVVIHAIKLRKKYYYLLEDGNHGL